MRFFQCFKTKEERSSWEKEMEQKSNNFKVCYHTPTKQLAKEVYLSETIKDTYKYAVIWRWLE